MKKIKKSGFSLMEMMIVLLIVAIVAAATAPLITKKMAKSGGGAGSGAISWLNMKDYGNAGKGSLIIGAKTSPANSKVYINSNNADQPQLGFGSNGTLTGILGIQPIGRISFGGVQGNMAAATADNATAIGSHAQAGGASSIALGNNATAPAENSVSIGRNASVANANATNSIAIGQSSQADGIYAVAIGNASQYGFNNVTAGSNAVAIGPAAQASGTRAIAIGSAFKEGSTAASRTSASAQDSIAIGTVSLANQEGAIALGRGAWGITKNGIAIGRRSSAASENSIGIGTDVNSGSYAGTPVPNTIAIGTSAQALHQDSVAIGHGASTTIDHQIVLGTTRDTVYIPGNLVVNGATVLGYADDGKSEKYANHKSYVFLRESGHYGDIVRFEKADGDTSWFLSTGGSGKSKPESASPPGFPVYTERCDRRLKNVGEKFVSGLEQVKKLDLYNFTFKADKAKTPQVGIMAQDLQKVFPNAVSKGEDGYLRIRWDEMFYAVINAVKELDAKVTTAFEQIKANTDKVTKLQAQVDEQQKVIADLEKRLAKLEKKE